MGIQELISDVTELLVSGMITKEDADKKLLEMYAVMNKMELTAYEKGYEIGFSEGHDEGSSVW